MAGTQQDKKYFPTNHEIETGGLGEIPRSLLLLLDQLIVKKKKTKDSSERAGRKSIGIANAIMQASLPRKFISPLLFSVGVYLHRKFDSKELIELMASLGFSITYAEVLNFEKCTAITPSPAHECNTTFQYVFDNADINIETIDGKDTFHCLGGLMIATPKLDTHLAVKRLSINEKVENIGTFGVLPIFNFKKTDQKRVSYTGN